MFRKNALLSPITRTMLSTNLRTILKDLEGDDDDNAKKERQLCRKKSLKQY